MAKHGKTPVFVLFYHRVADNHLNPWTITRAEFQEQIDWFQANFEIVDLQECQRRIESGFNDRPTLAITFDDGYSENCEWALPMLIERRIPITYFVTTHHTANQQPFPHDVDRGVPLPVNTIESLRSLDMAGIEIGAHTRTHPSVGDLREPEEIFDEVITASREMEKHIGRPMRYFAFPFGLHKNLNSDAIHLLKREGFLGFCSAYGGYNEIGNDSFQIQRLHGDRSISRIKNWLTFDPRVLKTKRFEYSTQTIDWDEFEATRDSKEDCSSEVKPTNPTVTFPEVQSTPLLSPNSNNENA